MEAECKLITKYELYHLFEWIGKTGKLPIVANTFGQTVLNYISKMKI